MLFQNKEREVSTKQSQRHIKNSLELRATYALVTSLQSGQSRGPNWQAQVIRNTDIYISGGVEEQLGGFDIAHGRRCVSI